MSGHARELQSSQVSLPAGSVWSKLPAIGLVLGVIGLGASVVLGGSDHGALLFSYLVAWVYFVTLGLGGLFFVLTQHVTRAGWGVVVRRLAENVALTLPVMGLLFIPIALGIHDLYHWSHADAVAHDPILAGKTPYLAGDRFVVRAILFFAVWTVMAWWFRRESLRQDENGAASFTRRMQAVSAPATLVFGITLTLGSFDWVMSLDPHWYSTIFGVYIFAGSAVGIFATLILVARGLQRSGALDGVVTVHHYHDLGKLLFGFTVFWAYIAFSQFMLIWYANIPEETLWYAERWHGSWQVYSIALAVGHFGLPFLILLSSDIKKNRLGLQLCAVWMLAWHYLDLYWLVMPGHADAVHFTIVDATTFLGVGGIFLGTLGWLLRGRAIVPVNDPRLTESLQFHNA